MWECRQYSASCTPAFVPLRMLFSSLKPPPAVSKGNHTPQFSTLNLSRVYCKVTHFSGDMQAFSALFSGGGKIFVFLDICPQITQIYTDFIILNSRSHTDTTDFHRFFLQLQGNRCWVEYSLFSAHKVIIPLRSQLSVLNSKCAEQPSGNSEDVQSFPDGIVVRGGKRRAQFYAG